MLVFGDVEIVIEIDELMILHLPEDGEGYDRQDDADRYHVTGFTQRSGHPCNRAFIEIVHGMHYTHALQSRGES